MKFFERFLYDMIKKNAPLKNVTVYLYQSVFSVLSFFKPKLVIKPSVDMDLLGPYPGFFGFHDRASVNENGFLLSHKQIGKFDSGMGKATIGFYVLGNANNFHVITETSCCNYQQGSMLTWFSKDSIIFNDYDKGPVTVVKSIEGEELLKLPFHFYSISSCSTMVTSIDFYSFGKGMKGYGYSCFDNEVLESDPCFNVVNVNSGKLIFSISVSEAKILSDNLIEDGDFYFSHSKFSPDSTKVYFMLRSSNRYVNKSQLFVFDLKDSKLIAIPSGGMVSHLDWVTNTSIICYMNNFDKVDDYYIVDISEINRIILTPINSNHNRTDGHPSTFCRNTFITDTYADRSRYQHLYLIDFKNQASLELMEIKSPIKYRGVNRVDLHPRFSSDRSLLSIDTSYTGRRAQLVFKSQELLENCSLAR
ncbi:hypothetical protein AB6C61_00030 [Vibrio splendidus]